jgi:cell division transport system permease protein
MGAEGIKLLGFNPIPNSIEVHFRSGFVAIDSLNMVKTALEKNPGVREAAFDNDVVSNLDKTMRLAELLLLGLSLLIAVLSIGLINSAIRLNMYARRFLIKSMQMVGATRNFIRKPFILAGIAIGFCGALFAACLLIASVMLIPEKFRLLFAIHSYFEPAVLLFSLIIMGVLIAGLSSYFAINKYLKLKLDDLF